MFQPIPNPSKAITSITQIQFKCGNEISPLTTLYLCVLLFLVLPFSYNVVLPYLMYLSCDTFFILKGRKWRSCCGTRRLVNDFYTNKYYISSVYIFKQMLNVRVR
jgi:hypothetical protein